LALPKKRRALCGAYRRSEKKSNRIHWQ
jgi:hypothetical protein